MSQTNAGAATNRHGDGTEGRLSPFGSRLSDITTGRAADLRFRRYVGLASDFTDQPGDRPGVQPGYHPGTTRREWTVPAMILVWNGPTNSGQ
jgi:hypothetical protein